MLAHAIKPSTWEKVSGRKFEFKASLMLQSKFQDIQSHIVRPYIIKPKTKIQKTKTKANKNPTQTKQNNPPKSNHPIYVLVVLSVNLQSLYIFLL